MSKPKTTHYQLSWRDALYVLTNLDETHDVQKGIDDEQNSVSITLLGEEGSMTIDVVPTGEEMTDDED